MTAFAETTPFGASGQLEQDGNWRRISDVVYDLASDRILRCRDLLTALGRYEGVIRIRGGVDAGTAIDGTPRRDLPHRQGMPTEWSAQFYAILGLCPGDNLQAFLERIVDTFASVEMEAEQPSMDAMLCVAEDLVILAKIYEGRPGA